MAISTGVFGFGIRNVITFLIYSFLIFAYVGLCNGQKSSANLVENIKDMKDFKKLMKTKTNVLVLYTNSEGKSQSVLDLLSVAAKKTVGKATVGYVYCAADSERKKLCKKLKATPSTYILKHYKNGEFHKDYDRREKLDSIVTFLDDPTGDLPWEEDEQAEDVVHIPNAQALQKMLKKEKKPTLVMFYAPWCGFCKRLKPPYADAATELMGTHVLAAMDVNRPENNVVREALNITGFPTTILFEAGRQVAQYSGEPSKDKIVAFMKDPAAAAKTPEPKEEEPAWSEEKSEVVHLTDGTFATFLSDNRNVLVMFYAPWCGHCKKMKPEFTAAAAAMAAADVDGKLAAVDATKETALGKKFEVKGYPTVKFFQNGEFMFDVPHARTQAKLLEFMNDPSEPPPPPPPEPEWADNPDTSVDHLTQETFKTHLKKKKHALVMFYAPWCGHCKAAKPEFEQAAERFADDLRVSVAAVDCTKERDLCSVYGVQGFPTFKYLSYLDRDQQDYAGGRTSKDFIEFLESPFQAEFHDGKTEL